MRNRFHQHFREAERAALLKAAGEWRNACIKASQDLLFDDKPIHHKCEALIVAADDLVEMLTGDREYLWGKPLTSPATGL